MMDSPWEGTLETVWRLGVPFTICLLDGRTFDIETKEQIVFRDSDFQLFEVVLKRSADSELVELIGFDAIASIRFKRPRALQT